MSVMDRGLAKSLVESTAGEWLMILSFVFGGCCSNVWALEAVLKDHPKSGTFLTFAQFLYVTIQNVSSQVVFPPTSAKSRWSRWIRVPSLRKRQVPLKRWLVQVLLFLAVSLMNNYAFALKIPVTLHIIFRSGGLCVSMLTGYLMAGRRYSMGQVLAGMIITSGIVMATLSVPRRTPSRPAKEPTFHTQSMNQHPTEWFPEGVQFFAGIGLLSLALVVSAWLGLWQEETYRLYGKKWREALFYSHFLSLPFFIPMYSSLSSTFTSFTLSPPITLLTIPDVMSTPPMALLSSGDITSGAKSELLRWKKIVVPSAIFALGMNVLTQGLCIRGVNRLTTKVNSTTVNLILTLRKAVSLGISVWYYGSGVSPGLAIGGSMVLLGTVIYSMAPAPKFTVKVKDVPNDTTSSEMIVEGKSTAMGDQRRVEGIRDRGQKVSVEEI